MRGWVRMTFLVSIAGCGSNGGSGAVTSLPGSKTLATLSTADATQLCGDSVTYLIRNVSVAELCKRTGYDAAVFALETGAATTDAQIQMVCMTAVNQCPSPVPDGGAGTCSLGDTSSCATTATVDEYSLCISDATATLKAALPSFPTCSALTVASVAATQTDGGSGTATPPSCTKLMTDCPNISLP